MIPEMIRKYKVIESVGTGAFSEVFKAINVETGILVALKHLKVTEECRREVAKEVLIHQLLRHQNIIKFIESFECDENIFIVQELGSGGELFEQIEPDVGFPEQVAHFYFVQLIRTIMYLHKSGICHRDLKPENLLLDGDGNLKLADFGLSTVFRRGRIRRKLTTRCGTPAYMLPEVSKSAEYEGDDADIWSCCIILIILLTGNVPWETCTLNCSEFLSHVKDGSNFRINSLPEGPRRIINETLKLEPSKRWKISEISTDPWFIQANPLLDFNFMASEPAKLIQLIRENSSTQLVSLSIPPLALTQPDQIRSKASVINDNFSQPPSSANSNEIELSESSKVFVRNNFARFLCKGKLKKVLEKMEQVLQEMLVPFKMSLSSEFTLHFQTVDRRKCPLIGIIRLQNLDGSVLVVIKKQRGNPIEYGRFFKFIVDEFSDLI